MGMRGARALLEMLRGYDVKPYSGCLARPL